MKSALHLDDILQQAASLTFAILRFAEGAAHPFRASTPPGVPRLGEDIYVFAPSSRRVLSEDVPTFLAALPSPAVLWPTTTRGMVSLHLLSEVSNDRAASLQHEFENQRAGVAELAAQLGLTLESKILLEFEDEAHIVALTVLQAWSERFAVGIGWNIGALEGDARASARLNLFRSDGINTTGVPPLPGMNR